MATDLQLLAHHPAYDDRAPDWTLVQDCYAGQREVKAKGETYLPPTSGMREAGYGLTGQPGHDAYEAYKLRARFPGFVRQAVTGLAGVIHRKPPVVKVPPALDAVVAKMTRAGESLEVLWQRITETQLLEEHGGLLVDVLDGVSVAEATPYVALYKAPCILNWNLNLQAEGRAALGLVVLDESTVEQMPDLTWESVTAIRLLAMSPVAAGMGLVGADERVEPVYQVGEAKLGASEKGELVIEALKTPAIGGRPLTGIPFVFFGTVDLAPEPGVPPMLDLAELSLTVYRGDADYRHTLFMQSQSTLVRIGANPDPADADGAKGKVATGVGAVIDMPTGGDAKFIGVESGGLSEQRQALENDKREASMHVVQLLDAGGGKDAESGEALRVRVSARTATLSTMQTVAAAALREVLVIIGRWLGLAEEVLAEEIEVIPNLDFAEGGDKPDTITVLVDAKLKGAPITWRDIYDWMRKREIVDRSYEETQEQLAVERTDGATGGTKVDLDPSPAPPLVPEPEVTAA